MKDCNNVLMSSKNIIALALIFKYLMHSELSFECGKRYWCNFILFNVDIQLSSLIKKNTFLSTMELSCFACEQQCNNADSGSSRTLKSTCLSLCQDHRF